MMLERIGIIGKQHGVRDSSSPKPKKLATSNQKLAFLNNCAMRPDSSSLNVLAAASVALAAIWRCRRVRQFKLERLPLRRIADAGVGATLRSDFQGQRQWPGAVAFDRNADQRLLVIDLDVAEIGSSLTLPGGSIGVPSCTLSGSAAKRNLSR
jgi:hypothetical protein